MDDLISRQKMLQTYQNLCANTLCIECPFHFGDAVTGDCLFEKWIKDLPSTREIIHCKDCRKRDTDECPMRHVEQVTYEEDGYIEFDEIIYDYTELYGFCDRGEEEEGGQ